MSAPQPRQLWLPLSGPGQHFELLHGGHSQNVAVCSSEDTPDSWQQRLYRHDDALATAVGLVAGSDLNIYQSQHGFAGNRRVASAASALTSVFVDLDYYKLPELQDLDAEQLLDRILAAHPWLPPPTMLFNSGRGAYLSWVFPAPLTADKLPRWQTVENIIVALLEPFGADPAVKDPARVLRVVGSINRRNGELVTGVSDTGRAVTFEQLETAARRYGMPALEALHDSFEPGDGMASPDGVERATRRSRPVSEAQRAQYLRDFQLAYDRMGDCRALAALRGLPLRDCRGRLAFAFATSAAWYATTEEQLAAEIEAFAADHFEDGERYGRRKVGNVIDKLRQDNQGIIGIYRGQRVPMRYRLKNRYLIRLLEVTIAEQRELRTIIGPEERHRRRVARRREAGMVDRQARAEERLQRAVELRQRGLSQAAIADELGITQQGVSKMLRQARGGYN